MKSLKIYYLFLAFAMFMISCDSSGTGEGENGEETTTTEEVTDSGPATMTATVAGSPWEATNAKVTYEEDLLVISGTGKDASAIRLEIGETPAVGIFPVRRGKIQNASYTNAGGSKYHCPFQNTIGVINIELIDADRLEGTFSFSASNFSEVINVESGRFSLPMAKKPEM